MTRLECAKMLLWNLKNSKYCNEKDMEAFAYAIMELGRSEMEEEITKRNEGPYYEAKSPKDMEGTGAPPREWM